MFSDPESLAPTLDSAAAGSGEGPLPAPPPLPALTSRLPRGTQIGHYVILEHLGSGGMGSVFAAYDPRLDRRIALKILHDFGLEHSGNHARLLREAQALARLSHPNVVTVHDVGTFGDQLFIAMELVEGVSLRRWLDEEPRSVDEVLAVFRMAGEGLCAAHGAGLVHRDFKPDNALLDKTGRVCVMDFGLARPIGGQVTSLERTPISDQATQPISGGKLDEPLTQDGALLGTPGYMAPEQLIEGWADERSDQFAFCVALYEGLYRDRPFAARTIPMLAIALSNAPPKIPKDDRIPLRVREALQRGLDRSPDKRFPSLRALLDELAPQKPIGRRSTWLLGSLLLVLLSTLTFVAWPRRATPSRPTCQPEPERLAGAWDAARRTAVHEAFTKLHRTFATDTLPLVERELDAYAKAWIAQRSEACAATRIRGTQSDQLFSLRTACLDSKLPYLAALTEQLATADTDVAQNAVAAVRSLPPLAECADSSGLLRGRPQPSVAPELRAPIQHVDDEATSLHALFDAGRYQLLRDRATKLVSQAERLAYDLGTARARYWLGAAQDRLGDYRAAEATLFSALHEAERANDEEGKVRILTVLARTLGVSLARPQEGVGLGLLALGILERTGRSPELLVPLHTTLGEVELLRGALDAAERHYDFAREVGRKVFPAGHLQLLRIDLAFAQLASRRGQYADAHTRYLAARTALAAEVGAKHPLYAELLQSDGVALRRMGQYAEAIHNYEEALTILRDAFGEDHPLQAAVLNNLAVVHQRQGALQEAFTLYHRARLMRERTLGPEHPLVGASMNNEAIVLHKQQRLAEAKQLLLDVLALYAKALPVDHPSVGTTLYNLAVTLTARKEYDAAIERLLRAIAIKERLGDDHPELSGPYSTMAEALLGKGDAEHALPYAERSVRVLEGREVEPTERGEALFTLARAVLMKGGERDRGRAMELVEAAREHLVRAGADSERKLRELDDWCATHRVDPLRRKPH